MSFKSTILLSLAATLPMALSSSLEAGNQTLDARQSCQYSGPWEDFPPMSSWLQWGDIFNAYEQSMVDAGSSFDDVGRIAVAIEQAAADIGVDERVILGIILQESSGYVGVCCTGSGDCSGPDCGLMQCDGCPGFPGQNELPQVCKKLSLTLINKFHSNICFSPTLRLWSTEALSTSRLT